MKKLTRQNLDELRVSIPLLLPDEMDVYIGGYYSRGSNIIYNGGTLPEVVVIAPSIDNSINLGVLLYQLQQTYGGAYNDVNSSMYNPSFNYGGGNGVNDSNVSMSGDVSSSYYLEGSLWKASPSIAVDTVSTLSKRSQVILDDRGKYYADG